MSKILLIRPGITEYDQQGRIQGTLDIPLCEDGRRQVEALVEQLRDKGIAAIYTSPNQASEQTAEALGEAFDVKVKTLDAFQNLDHGLWQGQLVADVKTKQPRVYRQWQDQPETVCPPQGETIGDVEERMHAAVAKLVKKHKGDTLVAVVLPEPVASLLRHFLLQNELGDLWKCRNGNGAPLWEIVEFAPEVVGSK
jgi:broad specificity phosphatase PhoE